MDPIFLTLLQGATTSKTSPLRILGYDIIRLVISRLVKERKTLIYPQSNYVEDRFFSIYGCPYIEHIKRCWSTKAKKEIQQFYDHTTITFKPYIFPESTGININMMPIRLGDYTTIPDFCREYIPLIEACYMDGSEIGKIGYLTIMETDVEPNNSQRRPGLHTEAQGYILEKGKLIADRWGGFTTGGIYLASTVPNSCRIYRCQVDDSLIGFQGSVEHLRHHLNKKYSSFSPKANELVWITDTTPHESLPILEKQHRQFFRLVCSQVSMWYEQHSTKNPLGIVPGEGTKIIKLFKKF